MNLILVRHGQSIWNLENKFTGWVDVGLSERGIKEAEEAAKTLLSYNFTPKICFTSFLKRSKSTAEIILNKMNEETDFNIETKAIWQLNERHYGALQGLDKIETAKKYGQDQVQLWRRSYDVFPPLAEIGSKFDPKTDKKYENIKEELPLGESLEKVVERVNPTFINLIELAKTKQVLVIAHGNSIRAMVKMLDNLSNVEIVDVNIPTGIPLAYKISENENVKIGYLGDLDKIEQLQKEVELQSKVKDEKG